MQFAFTGFVPRITVLSKQFVDNTRKIVALVHSGNGCEITDYNLFIMLNHDILHLLVFRYRKY